MIHKKMAYRASSGKTLKYIFRGDGHEHDVVDCVHHIHTQGMSPNPIKRGKEGKVEEIDTTPMEQEFDFLGAKNQRSENKVAHYVISLPPGETLTHEEWADVAKNYMRGMGYDLNTKWTCALHDEKDAQHIHIAASRVVNNPKAMERTAAREQGGKGNKPQPYPLVADSNDHARGMEIMRQMEHKYGLAVVQSPDQTWGADLSREEFDGTINAFEKTGKSEAPWKTRIIARLSKAVQQSKGGTFTEFLDNVRAVGVEPLVTINDRGFPTGISYSMEGRSAAGSKLKSTRLTFSAITGAKYDRTNDSMKSTDKKNEGINYEQARDISACISTNAIQRADGSTPEIGGPRPAPTDAKERGKGKEASEPKSINIKTMGAPLTRSAASKAISMSARGGINELLNINNFYTDLDMHASHVKKMARLQWGDNFNM